jgi:hypothetical protein
MTAQMTPHDRLFGIVQKALDRGLTVEIEGLGSLRPRRGGCTFEPQTKPQVFVAYAVEDLAMTRRLCAVLRQADCSVWLDKDKLLPGQNWPRAIERAINISDVFVACFSSRSVAKRGQFQSELRYALDCARRIPLTDESPFIIPVRFDACAVPRRISEHLQYADLFPDWNRGVQKVIRAIRRNARQRVVRAA